jgi:hypothetical protein
MTTSSNNLHLTMPIGIPAQEVDIATYYQNLKQAMSVTVASNETVRIWTSDDDQYTTLFAMAKGALRFLPKGAQGPKSIPVTDATLVLKIWIWDYLNLRKSVAPGKSLPKLITYGNVDEAKVRTAIQQEVGGNPRYAKRTAIEKTAMVDAFMKDGSRLLISAGIPIGQGVPDSSTDAPMSGARRVDLEFVHRDGTVASPNDVFEVWSITLGPSVEDHPLLGFLRGPIVPSVVPLEGGLRVRIAGVNIAAGTVAELDGVALSDQVISVDGQSLHGTAPAAVEGKHTLVLRPPGGGETVVIGTVTYVTDVATTARAVVAAHSVRLQEIRDTVARLKTEGGLDDPARSQIFGWLSELHMVSSEPIISRSLAGGGSFRDPSVNNAWVGSATSLGPLMDEIYTLLN